jgi:acetyltransferase-like isoleucine patch superfamily enzyme
MLKLVRVTSGLLQLLRDRRVFHGLMGQERWQIGEPLGVASDAVIEPYSHIFGGQNIPAALGAFSYSHSALPAHVSVGRYCSIARGVTWLGVDHPVDWATTSPAGYDRSPLQGFQAYVADRNVGWSPRPYTSGASVSVGHDVWIGEEAMIAQGVRIGDGAVVAARSLVTSDVEPYAIVMGAPARLHRRRLPPEIASALQEARWWRYGPEVVQALDPEDPAAFAARLGELDAAPVEFAPLTGEEIIAASASFDPSA